MEKNKISDEELERIKNNLDKFSYIDLVAWRNQMIASREINNRLFNLLNDEILRRVYEYDLRSNINKSK